MIKSFFAYYKPYKKLFFLDFFCAVIVAGLEIVFPVVVNKVIREYLPDQDLVLIITAVSALVGFYIFSAMLQYIVTYFGHKLGHLIERDMRKRLFNHLTLQPFTFYDDRKVGELMSRMTTDLFEIGEVAHHGPEDIFIAISSLIVTFVLMFYVHPILAVISVVLVPIITVLIVYFNKRMTKVNREIYNELADFNSGIESVMSGIRVVKAFSNEEFENQKFYKLNEGYKNAKLKFYQVMGLSHTINTLLIRLLSLIALLASSVFYIKGYISDYSDVIYFILLTNVLIKPIEKMNAVIESYPKGIAGFKRYQELLSIKPSIVDKTNAEELNNVLGNIEYKNVSFSYGEEKEVLSKINFKIKAGETIAFVGPSGGGKSTLCNLLPRFYDITGGDILIDSKSIQDVTLKSLRENIGIVQQEVFIFNGSLRDNIKYGKLDATEEEILKAAKYAQLDEVIKDLEFGLDTILGDRGIKLSGGQRQRLSIARMFLKNPPILILDEATSALDSTTEMLIQESLEKLSKGRTTLVIAHRLSTIKNADRIFVITKKGILESGTHKELLNNNGMYAKLYNMQFDIS
ncbi:ABC transporter ATP-binding protein [Haploplasma axanthum]|uniref:ABC-type multidrug/protein/lipid transport system ATPase component n=1 Tax=Haploplasma axanthum TaxID=29552 RepID=A0A449BC18_HAPAX|nr:ABC transporter ATP-binding protein [Haploplasma axanthum]VEU79972.1 ABC-type multidrug/protein/lipid transport system ATPase component [Haploplasma axanthum]